MKKFALTSLSLFLLSSLYATDSEGAVCKKCQLVREFNEQHPSKYEFYDDYLKDKEDGVAEDVRFDETQVNLK